MADDQNFSEELHLKLLLYSQPNPKLPDLEDIVGDNPTSEQVIWYTGKYSQYKIAEGRRLFAKRWREQRNLEEEYKAVVIQPRSEVQKEPLSDDEVKAMMGAEMSREIREKYIIPYSDYTIRSDPLDPERRYVSQTSAGRMHQLVECFPEGVGVDYFLKTYRDITGCAPVLNGYSFPKDSDPEPKFALTSTFWIPDNDAHYISERLLFPVESRKNYGGSLKSLMQIFWDQFLAFMRKRESVKLSETFSGEDNIKYFYGVTGIWFSYRRWGMDSYTQFFEMLLQNFDPENKLFTILYLPPEDYLSLSATVYLVITGENGEYARQFEAAANSKFCLEIPFKSRPSHEEVPWRYQDLKFVALKTLAEVPFGSRLFEVVAAGNIWNFYQFHVLLMKDIPKRDQLLESIHDLVKTRTQYTIPKRVLERNIVMFQLEYSQMWRRGLVIRREKNAFTCSIMDIDTGETNPDIPLSNLRNITAELVALPVYAIPVRFSVHSSMKHHFVGNPEGNRVLGKYLHMLLAAPNKGLRLRFHWWDAEATYYTPGLWVVSGHLFDVIRNSVICPVVPIAKWLLNKYRRRCGTEVLPEWQEVSKFEENWAVPDMVRRSHNLEDMMNRYKVLGAPSTLDSSTQIPVLLDIEMNYRNEIAVNIFRDVEFHGCRPPLPDYYSPARGIRKLTRYEAILGVQGKKEQFPPEHVLTPKPQNPDHWTPKRKRGSQPVEKEQGREAVIQIYWTRYPYIGGKIQVQMENELPEALRNLGNGISKWRRRTRIKFAVTD